MAKFFHTNIRLIRRYVSDNLRAVSRASWRTVLRILPDFLLKILLISAAKLTHLSSTSNAIAGKQNQREPSFGMPTLQSQQRKRSRFDFQKLRNKLVRFFNPRTDIWAGAFSRQLRCRNRIFNGNRQSYGGFYFSAALTKTNELQNDAV